VKKITEHTRAQEKRTEVNERVLDYIKAIMDNNDEEATAFQDLVDAADLAYTNNHNAWGKFVSACAKAGVPNDVRRYLWHLLRTGSVVDAKDAIQDASFCWG
jgi:hypothetical protein